SSFFNEIPEGLLKRINRAGAYANARAHAPAARAMRGGYAIVEHEISPPDQSSPWRIGQNVTHPKFGAGVIVNAEGRGNDARVQVNFHRNGTKWLALEYAKLSAA
ncbi:MAG: DNA helicase II, partial [Burkholderiales bacterium]